MFKKILVPVDLSNRHQQAITAAKQLAQQSGGQIELLHVIEVMAGLSLDEEREFYHRLERKARTHLSRLVNEHKGDRVAWRCEIRFGSRGPEIVRHAAENEMDLIILTSPKLDPSKPDVGWGSLSYKIGLMAMCPILLVK